MTTHHATARAIATLTMSRRTLFAQTAAAGLAAAALASFTGPRARAADSISTRLDEVLRAAVARGFPGVSLYVERAGEPVYAGTAGFASTELKTPLTAAHRFRLGSVAKPSTAITTLQLVEEGVLSLDDTPAKWLDDPAVARIPNVETVTLRQLLNHTSGIYDYIDENDSPLWGTYLGENPDFGKVWSLPELLTFADGANHAPYFEPGESWAYSNTGYILLGLIIEKVTGNRLADELLDRVLRPLALDDTFLVEGADLPDGMVDCYQALEGELVNVTGINLSWGWAAGWTISTMADFARFGRAVLDGELLSPASVDEMFAFVPDPRFAELGWGMGVWLGSSAYGAVKGMGGDGPGFTSNLARLAEEDLTVAVLLNSAGLDGGSGVIRDDALTVVLGPAEG